MINVIISGAKGQMGRSIANLLKQEEDMKVVAGLDLSEEFKDFPIYNDINKIKVKADVIMDFSNPQCTEQLCKYATEHKTPLVVGTTGLKDEHRRYLQDVSKLVPVLVSSNMHVGTVVFATLAKYAAKLLPDFDIEIVERHHNQKIDAPSGTALIIADAIKEVRKDAEYVYNRQDKIAKRKKNEIGIFAVRAGNLIGEHRVIFGGEDETLELYSLITSRRILSAGAIKAAKFVVKKAPGYYTLQDICEDLLKS